MPKCLRSCAKLMFEGIFANRKKGCHCEPARTLVWQSPKVLGRFRGRNVGFPGGFRTSGGLPHQAAAWFAMTVSFVLFHFKQQFTYGIEGSSGRVGQFTGFRQNGYKKTRHMPRNCGNYSLTFVTKSGRIVIHTVILCLPTAWDPNMVILSQMAAAVKRENVKK